MNAPPDVLRILAALARRGYPAVRVAREINCPQSTLSRVKSGSLARLSYERQEALKQIYAKICLE